MSREKRKSLLLAIACLFCMSAMFVSLRLSDVQAKTVEDDLLVPQLTQRWDESMKLVGEESTEFLSDFALFRDGLGRWHAIGIGGNGDDKSFFHALGGEDFSAKFRYLARVQSNGSAALPNTGHMWAPYVVTAPTGETYLFYHHYNELTQSVQMRVLVPTDEGMETWTPLNDPTLEEGNVVFRRGACRDACIFFDETEQLWFMYYADSGIQLCTSSDLLHWSESVTVLSSAPYGFVEPESPFVLKKEGNWYLLVSGHDYGRVAVYVSDDPRNFGNGLCDSIGEWNGHAPEIVDCNGKQYVACAAIHSAPADAPYPGGEPAQTNLSGLYIQELSWVQASAAKWLDVSALLPQEVVTEELILTDAASSVPQAGQRLRNLDRQAVERTGLKFIDDRESGFTYHWRYEHESQMHTPADAYGQTSRVNGYALDATLEYDFTGRYLGVVMRTAANVAVLNFYIDGELKKSVLPKAESVEFAVVFADATLSPGPHHLLITVTEGVNPQDWYAEFDALIVESGVSVTPPVPICEPDANVYGKAGQTLTLYALFENPAYGILRYQWYKDGVALAGETLPYLRLTDFDAEDEGAYSVKAFCETLSQSEETLSALCNVRLIDEPDQTPVSDSCHSTAAGGSVLLALCLLVLRKCRG